VVLSFSSVLLSPADVMTSSNAIGDPHSMSATSNQNYATFHSPVTSSCTNQRLETPIMSRGVNDASLRYSEVVQSAPYNEMQSLLSGSDGMAVQNPFCTPPTEGSSGCSGVARRLLCGE